MSYDHDFWNEEGDRIGGIPSPLEQSRARMEKCRVESVVFPDQQGPKLTPEIECTGTCGDGQRCRGFGVKVSADQWHCFCVCVDDDVANVPPVGS